MRSAARRWVDEEAPRRLDLRLVCPALAVWVACLVAIWTPGAIGWSGLAAAGVALAVGILIRRRGYLLHGLVAVALCFGAGLLVAGLQVAAAAADPLVVAAADGQWVAAEVVIDSDPVPVRDRFAGLDGLPDDGTFRIAAHARSVTPGAVGDGARSRAQVTVFGKGEAWAAVTPRQVLRLRGSATSDPFSDIPAVTIRARGDPELLADPPWWARWSAPAKAALIAAADSLEADAGGLLRGFVIGDTRSIPDPLADAAKVAGLTHLTAVSGTHLAIIAGMFAVVLRRFGPRWAAAGTVTAVAGMVVLVGPAPSVIRSGLMGLIGVSAVLAGRERNALPALAAAVLMLLLADPSLAASVGFALSVQATAGLVLLAPPWARFLQRRGVPAGWATLIAVPLAAHLVTMPVIAAISGKVSLVAVLANMAVAPVVAPALILGVICMVAGIGWPVGGALIARIDEPLLRWVATVAHETAGWPTAALPWRSGAAGAVLLAAVVLAGMLLLRFRPPRAILLAAVGGMVLVLLPAQAVHVGWPGDGWLLTACDVGQGDGLVLSTAESGTAVVVDTGPEPDLMDRCLSDLGISRVALVVITHLHADHTGGLPGVLRGRRVDAVGLGLDDSAPATRREIAVLARSQGVDMMTLSAGMTVAVGDLDLVVLGPTRHYSGTESDANNNSVVLRAEREGVRMLLTGDIEIAAQRGLISAGVDLRADILKQPHHGSARLLPEFLRAVSASVAVIGVGVDNGYGHPAPSALAADRNAGIGVILRTDVAGDVQVTWDDGNLATVSRREGVTVDELSGTAAGR